MRIPFYQSFRRGIISRLFCQMQWSGQSGNHWNEMYGQVGLKRQSTPMVYDMASFQRVHHRMGEPFYFVPKRRQRARQPNQSLASVAAFCVPCATFIDETRALPDLYPAKLLYHKSYIPPPSSAKNHS